MNDKTIELVLELVKQSSKGVTSSVKHPFEIGKQYFIRTVTYHSTGKVKDIIGDYLILEKFKHMPPPLLRSLASATANHEFSRDSKFVSHYKDAFGKSAPFVQTSYQVQLSSEP